MASKAMGDSNNEVDFRNLLIENFSGTDIGDADRMMAKANLVMIGEENITSHSSQPIRRP